MSALPFTERVQSVSVSVSVCLHVEIRLDVVCTSNLCPACQALYQFLFSFSPFALSPLIWMFFWGFFLGFFVGFFFGFFLGLLDFFLGFFFGFFPLALASDHGHLLLPQLELCVRQRPRLRGRWPLLTSCVPNPCLILLRMHETAQPHPHQRKKKSARKKIALCDAFSMQHLSS